MADWRNVVVEERYSLGATVQCSTLLIVCFVSRIRMIQSKLNSKSSCLHIGGSVSIQY